MRKCSSIIAVGVCLWGCFALSVGAAEPLRSGWECLPSECLAAIRIPQGSATAEAWRNNTKFGSVVFSAARLDTIGKWFTEENGPFRSSSRELEKLGLTAADFSQFFAGESGLAFLVNGMELPDGMPMMLVWFEPGEELAQRAWAALEKSIEDGSDDEHPVERIDVELEGRPAMQLTVPVISHGAGAIHLPNDIENLSEEERDAAINRAIGERDAKAKTVVRYTTVLVSRWDGRLVVVIGMEPKEEKTPDDEIERVTATYVKFLRAQVGDPEEFVANAAGNSGVRHVFDTPGFSMFELLVNVKPFFDVVMRDAEHPQVGPIIQAFGLDQLGFMAVRSTLDNTHLRTVAFVAAPAPRSGLLSLFDQTPVAAEPAPWVPSDVLEYQHASLDLGVVYKTVKDLLVSQFGQQVSTSLGFVETQVKGNVGTDLTGLLSSVGNVHTVLQFSPAPNANVEEKTQDESQRVAVVWQLRDIDLWTRVMTTIGEVAPLAGRELKATDEQGFRGWRFDASGGDNKVEGGLVMGNGYLVLGVGAGTLERVLACLNNPPTGASSLHTSELFERSRAAIPLKPGTGFSISDGARMAKLAFKGIESLFEMEEQLSARFSMGEDDAEEGEDREFSLEHLRRVLPTAEELDGVLGVSVGHSFVNEYGWVSESVLELPK